MNGTWEITTLIRQQLVLALKSMSKQTQMKKAHKGSLEVKWLEESEQCALLAFGGNNSNSNFWYLTKQLCKVMPRQDAR